MTEPMFEIWNEDCVANMVQRLGRESVDLTVTSIPFAALFSYSNKTEDIGNCKDALDLRSSQFSLNLRFWAEQLIQVMRPGCVVAIHIQQLLATKVQHGFMGRRDFRGAVVDIVSAAGFDWTGEISIPKNPQVIAQRLKLHSLMFVTGKRDSRALMPAVNDFVMIFRKPGEGVPVRCLYDAVDNPGGWVSTEEWIAWARGTWHDIRETDTLTGWKDAREEDDEKHVCPLQLEVIRRCVKLWTNPGGVVLDPFMGIGSTAVVALEQGRNAVGFELKDSYHHMAQRNCRMMLERRHAEQNLPLLALIERETQMAVSAD